MKKIIQIGMASLCVMGLTGCSNSATKSSSVSTCVISKTKDGSGLEQIDVEELEKKISEKGKFVLMLSTSTCAHCLNMRRTLAPYFCEHADIPFYEIEYDMLGDTVAQSNAYLTKIKELIPAFAGSTPHFFYFENGIIQSQKTGEMSEIEWNNFMIDNGLVKGKKTTAKQEDYKLAESKYLKEMSPADIMKKVKKKDDFYLLFAEENRYCAAFSETLKSYAAKHKTEFVIFNYSAAQDAASQEESESMNEAYTKMMDVLGQIQIAPSLFHIQKGKTVANTQDNLDIDELSEWMDKK